jgi:hypothetical protein
MNNRSVKVKIIEVTSSFVSFKYMSTNAKSRIRRMAFMDQYENGKIDVTNPQLLDK